MLELMMAKKARQSNFNTKGFILNLIPARFEHMIKAFPQTPNLAPCLHSDLLEAGCDEAGRGCLAGPVVAAAVLLNPDKPIVGLNDSKKLNPRLREQLALEIQEKALIYGIGLVSAAEIDKINILNASFLAMHRALDQLPTPEFILVDGNRFRAYRQVKHQCIVKGDSLYQSIAAASILAKTHRDALMKKLAEEFPHYGWEKNMGYPTAHHRKAIKTFGTSPFHRLSFRLIEQQLPLI
jgi:ribonuclease HII